MSDPDNATRDRRRHGTLRRRGRRRVAIVAATVGVIAVSQWLGRTAGSTQAERRQPLPGDELIDHPTVVTNHAATIPVPPDQVWPWLVQMGWHRGGWYTPRFIDRLLFPGNWPSATQLVPELQCPLQVGDRIPDGPPGTAWFVVERVDPPKLLVLHSTTHLPGSWRARWGAAIDWSWTFTLVGSGDGGTRLLLRVRGRTRPRWLTATYVAALIPADYVMAPGMLAGIRRRATPSTDGAVAPECWTNRRTPQGLKEASSMAWRGGSRQSPTSASKQALARQARGWPA